MTISDQLSTVFHIFAAMVIGALIGFEREFAQKPAGLRTHILVAGASALFASLGKLIILDSAAYHGVQAISADPTRIIVSTITGVSFLGAGTIIRHRQNQAGDIEGLTTAASLLFVSALGIAVAISRWVIAAGATVFALIVLRVIPNIINISSMKGKE